VKLVQFLKQVTANRHHRQHFRFNSTFFLGKLETPSGEYQHLARRSQQFWRDKESLCFTASFIADLFDSALFNMQLSSHHRKSFAHVNLTF
jgi:rhamnogalacturonyl hydrolase YesR